MKALLVYPESPKNTFWGLGKALKYVRRKAAFWPLGLLIIGAMLPKKWTAKLVDMNTDPLKDEDILWADIVLISAMIIHTKSAKEVIARCRSLGRKIVVGGPLFSSSPEEFGEVDHLFIGEAEITFPQFLKDLENGGAKRIYEAKEKPDLSLSPPPRLGLLNLKKYRSAVLQNSRGCPHDCDYCYVVTMFGRKMRVKAVTQIIAELNAMFLAGWRGSVFFVDDNFIGSKRAIKELLQAIIAWQIEHNFPFTFFTQADVNLAREDELLELMRRAGFESVFIGLESPNKKSLEASGKTQNAIDLVAVVRKIQRSGIKVMAGFMVGLKFDTAEIFQELLKFIQETGVVYAMLNSVYALPGTRFWKEMKESGKLVENYENTGTDEGLANFHPAMGRAALAEGYRKLRRQIYSPALYFARVRKTIEDLSLAKAPIRKKISLLDLRAFCLSLWCVGVFSRANWQYDRLLFKVVLTKWRSLKDVVEWAIFWVHFHSISKTRTA